MEIPFTTLFMMITGIIALTVGIAVYLYFNGGLETVLDLLLGLIRG